MHTYSSGHTCAHGRAHICTASHILPQTCNNSCVNTQPFHAPMQANSISVHPAVHIGTPRSHPCIHTKTQSPEQPPMPSHPPQHTELRIHPLTTKLLPCGSSQRFMTPPILWPPSWVYSMIRPALCAVLTHPGHTHTHEPSARVHTLTTALLLPALANESRLPSDVS